MAVDIKKLREMDGDQLAKQELDQRGEIWKLRLQMTTGQLQDPQKVSRARRELARIMTVRREMAIAAKQGGGR